MDDQVAVAIVGSRSFNDYDVFKMGVKSAINDWGLTLDSVVIVSGGARGADTLAKRFALESNLSMIVFEADWTKYGRSAGPIRNKQIVNEADFVIAFPSASGSPGTKSTIGLAKKACKPIIAIEVS